MILCVSILKTIYYIKLKKNYFLAGTILYYPLGMQVVETFDLTPTRHPKTVMPIALMLE